MTPYASDFGFSIAGQLPSDTKMTDQPTFTKIAKGRYSATVNGMTYILFKDAYTGHWRIRYEGGGPDWAGPFPTMREATEHFLRHV